MNIVKKMTIELSKDDVKQIIKEYLEKDGYTVVGDISIDVGEECVGYGMQEHNQVVFKGASALVQEKQKDGDR